LLGFLVPALRARPGQLALDCAGHMAGPSLVLCLGVPLARQALTCKVKEEFSRLFALPSFVPGDARELKEAVDRRVQRAHDRLKESLEPIAEQMRADRDHLLACVDADLEALSGKLSAIKADGAAFVEGLRAYLFPTADGGSLEGGCTEQEPRQPAGEEEAQPVCETGDAWLMYELRCTEEMPSPGELLFGHEAPHRPHQIAKPNLPSAVVGVRKKLVSHPLVMSGEGL